MIVLNSGIGNYVHSNGKKYSYFGGNNYLGLANHPVVKAASIQSIKMYGVNFSASRRTTGTADIHLELEKQLSIFKEKQDAINVIRTGCADVINIKIMKSGIEALDTAAIARSENIKLMIGGMLETKLALGCSVHVAAGLVGFDYIDMDPHIDPEKEPFAGGPEFDEPFYTISDDHPGIGIKKR